MQHGKSIKRIIVALLMCSVATFLLYWCFRQINFDLFWQELLRVNSALLIVGMAVVFTVVFSNAAQWRIFLNEKRRPPYRRLVKIVSISMMLANTVPWGHAAAVYLLGRIKKVGHTVALSVLTLDQLMGGLSKVIVYSAVIYWVPLPVWLTRAILVFIVGMCVLYVFLLVMAYRYRDASVLSAEKPRNLWQRFLKIVTEWAHHLHAVRNVRAKFAGIGYALLMRTAEALAIYCVQWAFGLQLPLWSAWLLVTAINLATMVPVTPGNLGVYEATVFYIYKYIGVEPTQAMTLAVFHHLVYLIPLVLPGYFLMIKSGIRVSRVLQQSPLAADPASEQTAPIVL